MKRQLMGILSIGLVFGAGLQSVALGVPWPSKESETSKTIAWAADEKVYPDLEIMSSCTMDDAKKATWVNTARSTKDWVIEVTLNGKTFALEAHGSMDLGTVQTKNCSKVPQVKLDARRQGDSDLYTVQFKDGAVKAKDAASAHHWGNFAMGMAMVGAGALSAYSGSAAFAQLSARSQQAVQLASFAADQGVAIAQTAAKVRAAQPQAQEDGVADASGETESVTVTQLGVELSIPEYEVVNDSGCAVRFTVGNYTDRGAQLTVQFDVRNNGETSSVRYSVFAAPNSTTPFVRSGISCGNNVADSANNSIVPSIVSSDLD